MKKAIFITVRGDSSRLPGKAFLEILGKTTIELVILRAKQIKGIDEVIVCTTGRRVDDAIVEIAKKCGVNYFRGSLEDKLERWLGAATQYNIDLFATMDGDDLLCDPELVELGLQQMIDEELDFIEAPVDLICGSFTYGIRTTALSKVCSIKGTSETEMMWVYFKDTALFRTATLNVKDPIFFDSTIRMTLDYIEDFKFFQKIFEHFKCIYNDLPLRIIVPYLCQNPEIIQINAFRRHDWASNQQRKTKLILKKAYE